jgi:hypothetical protein
MAAHGDIELEAVWDRFNFRIPDTNQPDLLLIDASRVLLKRKGL